MANLVEAKSLSNITSIAAEPPDRLPTRIRDHEPLTLYIARVPGSQDVFLTTMKPRDKVVTAQDVESSLYYCHLDCDKDEVLRDSLRDEDELEEVLEDKRRYSALPPDQSVGTVKRKSVPPRPISQVNSLAEIQPSQFNNLQAVAKPHEHHPIERKPVGSRNVPNANPPMDNVQLPRKILGPRPYVPASHPDPDAISTDVRGKENVAFRQHEETPPSLPPRTNSDLSAPDHMTYEAPPPLPLRRTTTEFLNDPHGGFALTLIRRDPSSGNQWNIGKISKDGTLFPSAHTRAAAAAAAAAPSSTVKLAIYNPGYSKFANPRPGSSNLNINNDENASSKVFERILSVQRRKSVSSSSRRSMFRSSNDVSRRQQQQHRDGPGGVSSRYDASPVVMVEGEEEGGEPANNPDGVPGLCFYSPWNGICEFSTGASGRTLKCRHSPPSSSSNEAAALVDPSLRRLNSSPVSELRLNLPVIGHSAGSSSRRPEPVVTSSSRSSLFSNSHHFHHRHRHSVSVDSMRSAGGADERDEWDDAEEGEEVEVEQQLAERRMDLSLGQERAGGGFGGKKAKLGKLIVEGEGLLMMDLVVAANMGFWWSLRTQNR